MANQTDKENFSESAKTPARASTKRTSTTPSTAGRPAAAGRRTLESTNGGDEDMAVGLDQLRKMLEENEKLKRQLEKQGRSKKGDDDGNGAKKKARIPRPSGSPTTWRLQEEMHLTGSDKKRETYKAIQRVVTNTLDRSPINWGKPWAQIPPDQIANLFATVRSQVGGMDRYTQDWATEGLARRLIKNRRSYSYRMGRLQVPEKFEYLKDNAAKRTDAPRGCSKRKAAEDKKKAVAKKARISKGKAKAKAIEESDEDEEEEEECGGGGGKERKGTSDDDSD